MKRAVLYITNPNKLNTTRCRSKHNWNIEESHKLFLTENSLSTVFLVSDQEEQKDLKKLLSTILQGFDKCSYVYHSDENMTVPKKVLSKCFPKGPKLLDGVFGMHNPDQNDKKELKTEIYNKYLLNVLDSISKTNRISNIAFDALWQVFEKKSGIDIFLKLMQDICKYRVDSDLVTDDRLKTDKAILLYNEFKMLVNESISPLNCNNEQKSILAKLRDELKPRDL